MVILGVPMFLNFYGKPYQITTERYFEQESGPYWLSQDNQPHNNKHS